MRVDKISIVQQIMEARTNYCKNKGYYPNVIYMTRANLEELKKETSVTNASDGSNKITITDQILGMQIIIEEDE